MSESKSSLVLTSAELMEWREIVRARFAQTDSMDTAIAQADQYIRAVRARSPQRQPAAAAAEGEALDFIAGIDSDYALPWRAEKRTEGPHCGEWAIYGSNDRLLCFRPAESDAPGFIERVNALAKP
jgi:hypothetical protein